MNFNEGSLFQTTNECTSPLKITVPFNIKVTNIQKENQTFGQSNQHSFYIIVHLFPGTVGFEKCVDSNTDIFQNEAAEIFLPLLISLNDISSGEYRQNPV